nr:DUF3137 domain-containing protein [uncultured Allomuricauda sp.]
MINFQTHKEELLPLLKKAESTRKLFRFFKTLNYISVFYIVFIFFSYEIIFHSFSFYHNEEWYIKKIIIWGPFFACNYINYRYKIKHESCQANVLYAFLRNVLTDFKFYPKKRLKRRELAKSGLFDNPHSFCKTGLLLGKVGNTKLSIGNVASRTGSILDNFIMIPVINLFVLSILYTIPLFTKKSLDQLFYNFLGMLAVADFNKKIKGTILVLPDKLEKKMGYFAKRLQSKHLEKIQLVNLEDPIFEKEFKVYATHQVEARYALTPSLMHRISTLKKKINRPIMLSFKGNTLYIAVEHPHGFFTLPQNKNNVSADALEDFYNEVTMAIDIVEDLNLNTKIWG